MEVRIRTAEMEVDAAWTLAGLGVDELVAIMAEDQPPPIIFWSGVEWVPVASRVVVGDPMEGTSVAPCWVEIVVRPEAETEEAGDE